MVIVGFLLIIYRQFANHDAIWIHPDNIGFFIYGIQLPFSWFSIYDIGGACRSINTTVIY